MLRFLALFAAVVLVDLLIIAEIGNRVGIWPALALILIPGLAGAALTRSRGAAVLSGVKRDLAGGRIPGDKILDGILIFSAGILLIIPGIITGLIGLTAFFPGARKFYRDWILRRIWRLFAERSLRLYFKKPL